MPFATIHFPPDYNLGKIMKFMTEEKLSYTITPSLKEMAPWVQKMASEEGQEKTMPEIKTNHRIDIKPPREFLLNPNNAVVTVGPDNYQEIVFHDNDSPSNETVDMPSSSNTSTSANVAVTRKRKISQERIPVEGETPRRQLVNNQQLGSPLFNGTLNMTPYDEEDEEVQNGEDKSETHPFVCGTCDMAFAQDAFLQLHVKGHSSKRMVHICTECGKQLPHLQALRDHLARHQGGTPHSCPSCGKGFANYGTCWKHKRKCNGDLTSP